MDIIRICDFDVKPKFNMVARVNNDWLSLKALLLENYSVA